MSDSDRDRRNEQRAVSSAILRDEDFRPLSATVRVEFGAYSDTAPGKGPNNDHYLVVRLGRSQETVTTSLSEAEIPRDFTEYGYAMLLADGLGAAAGGLASRIAVTTLVHLALHYGRWNVRVDSRAAFDIIERLDRAYVRADEVVKRHARTSRHLHGMATRLTAAYSAGDELFVAYTDRSLAYVYRDGRLEHISGERVTLSGSQATPRGRSMSDEDSKLSAVLSDAIGGSGRPGVWVDRFQLRDEDTLMLCTDGLTASLGEEQIAETLGDRRRPEDLCRRLIAAALETRSVENVTVLLAQYRIPGPAA